MKIFNAAPAFLALAFAQSSQAATCGGGSRGDGICPQGPGYCCSEWGHCGTSVEYCGGQPGPGPAPTQPTTPAPVPPTPPVTSSEENRMIAYLGNWQACPTTEQLAQYTHIVIAFAVSYTWAPGKNNCSPTCQIGMPPICGNSANPGLLSQLKAQGKKIIVSFGGAGMGGSWAGDQNDCWEYCYGREAQVVDRLTAIVNALDADGVDIDYEYFYEDNQNGSGFSKGVQAQNFLTQVTVGLRNSLHDGAEITHAPMDVDLEPHKAYYQLLKDISHTLDFIMPQYYNGITRPALDGLDGTGVGSTSALSHYTTIVNEFFGGDATKMVFGFCISDCSGTSSNANGNQAAQVMIDLSESYGCNGGAFFWVADHDRTGSWSSTVNQAMASSTSCSGTPNVTPSPTDAPQTPAPTDPPQTPAPTEAPATPAPGTPTPTTTPATPEPTTTPPTDGPAPSTGPCCPDGFSGALAYNQCTEFYHCSNGQVLGSAIGCPAGTLFDVDFKYCNWAMQVDCPGETICV